MRDGVPPGMRFGYFLSCEEYSPAQLVEQAVAAEEAGFEALWISDHYHPWNDEQGQSAVRLGRDRRALPGLLAAGDHRGDLPDGADPPGGHRPGRGHRGGAARRQVHPRRRHRRGAQRARARRRLAVGRRPARDARGGRRADPRALEGRGRSPPQGKHYQVDTARIYTLPDEPPPIYVSAFGPKALEVAARIGDGFISTAGRRRPRSRSSRRSPAASPPRAASRSRGRTPRTRASTTRTGSGPTPACPASWPRCCPARSTSSRPRSWSPASRRPRASWPGNDIDQHVQQLRDYVDAGYDEVYVANMGPNYLAMIEAYGRDVLPQLRELIAQDAASSSVQRSPVDPDDAGVPVQLVEVLEGDVRRVPVQPAHHPVDQPRTHVGTAVVAEVGARAAAADHQPGHPDPLSRARWSPRSSRTSSTRPSRTPSRSWTGICSRSLSRCPRWPCRTSTPSRGTLELDPAAQPVDQLRGRSGRGRRGRACWTPSRRQ